MKKTKFIAAFVVVFAILCASCKTTNEPKFSSDYSPADTRYLHQESFRAFGPQTIASAFPDVSSYSPSLQMQRLVTKYADVHLRTCEYWLDGNMRNPTGFQFFYFVQIRQPAIDISELLKISKEHPLLMIGPPIICPKTLDQAKAYLRDNKAGIENAKFVYANAAIKANLALSQLNTPNSTEFVLAKSTHFTILMLDYLKDRSLCETDVFLRVFAQNLENYEMYTAELQSLIKTLPDRISVTCGNRKRLENLTLKGHSEDVDESILIASMLASINQDWDLDFKYLAKNQPKRPVYQCNNPEAYVDKDSSPHYLIQHRLRAQLNFDIQSNYGSRSSKYLPRGYETKIQIKKVCDDSPLLSGPTNISKQTLEDRFIESITVGQHGYQSRDAVAGQNFFKRIFRNLQQDNVGDMKGQGVLALASSGPDDIYNISFNYNKNAQVNREKQFIAAFKKRREEVNDILLKASQRRTPITTEYRVFKSEQHMSDKIPSVAYQKLHTLSNKTSTIIHPHTLTFNEFMSNGKKYRTDDVISMFNAYSMKVFQDEPSNYFTDVSLVFKTGGDNGTNSRIFVAEVKREAIVGGADLYFLINEIKPKDIHTLKTLAIDYRNAKGMDGDFNVFNYEVTRNYQFYSELLFAMLKSINPSFDVNMINNSFTNPLPLLRILNDSVPTFDELFNSKRTNDFLRYVQITDIEAQHQNLVPLASSKLIKIRKFPILEDFTRNTMSLNGVSAMASQMQYDYSDVYKLIANRLGTLYLPLTYWGYNLEEDYFKIKDNLNLVKEIFNGQGFRANDYKLSVVTALYFDEKYKKCPNSIQAPKEFIIRKTETRGSLYGYQSTSVIGEEKYVYDERFQNTFKNINVNKLIKTSDSFPATLDYVQLFLKKESCSSPYLRQFETNLLRLVNDEPTLQSVYFDYLP